MTKITAGLFISLDGVVEAPDQWHFPYFNEVMGVAVYATLGAADTVLIGRKTYDSFAGACGSANRDSTKEPPCKARGPRQRRAGQHFA
jgi:dihydrofolate reductase